MKKEKQRRMEHEPIGRKLKVVGIQYAAEAKVVGAELVMVSFEDVHGSGLYGSISAGQSAAAAMSYSRSWVHTWSLL